MKYSEKIAILEKFIEARLGDMGFELVDTKLYGTGKHETLELYCERLDDVSINVGDCTEISARLKYAILAEGFFPGDFSLVVSSPGLDRVIKREKDFRKFMGSEVRVFIARSAGKGSIKGKLAGYDDGRITLIHDDGSEESIEKDGYSLVRLVPELRGFEGSPKKRVKTSKK